MASWSKQQEPVQSASEARPIPAAVPPPPPRHEDSSFPSGALAREENPAGLGGGSDLLLGAGAEFEGKLTFKGTVRIDAKFVGSIVTNDVLVVGERARIDAEITCGTVVVQGEVNGNVKAKSGVELHRSARIRGNVETPSLAIEKGAVLQGEVKMLVGEKAPAARSASASASALQ